MKELNELALVVSKEVQGELETNIDEIEKFVTERINDYTPEKYAGDADKAKKDRADLNKAKKQIADARKAVIDRYMTPVREFESKCKNLEKLVDSASVKLDEIVKFKENAEKDIKKQKIESIWNNKKFDLFDLDKVFNQKWLNKTAKIADIEKEIDAIIEQTYKDLKTIERFADDAETLKAHYLMNLDIAETIQYGDELQRQKEIAQKEYAERAEREHNEVVSKQKSELYKEACEFEREQELSDLASQALVTAGNELAKRSRKEFVISVKCFDEDLLKLKSAMNALGIEYSVEELDF